MKVRLGGEEAEEGKKRGEEEDGRNRKKEEGKKRIRGRED
jgi:hypothetical protein